MTTATTVETALVDDKPKRWPKHAVWIGLAIAIGNLPLYYGYITYASPDLRDEPWVNLPFSWLGLALAATGSWYVFKHGRGALKKGLAATALALTLLLVGLFNWYVLSFSYTLPESSSATAKGDVAPGFSSRDDEGQAISLATDQGESVSLSDYLGKKVVLVFYRGDW